MREIAGSTPGLDFLISNIIHKYMYRDFNTISFINTLA
jgi:hypothetical protein